jgi:rRNA maturation endonuclease Nob1
MKCSACSVDISDDSKFCPECGVTVTQSVACNFCNEPNLPSASFCAECGKPMKADLASVAAGATSIKSQAVGVDFAYMLDEDSYRSVSTAKIEIPYGGIAVTLIDGKVSNIQEQKNYEGNKNNSIVDFLKGVFDSATALIGRQNQEVKTYILLNIQGLPIVSYTHPIASPGALDASLRFDFWIDSAGEKSTPEQLRNVGLFFQRCIGNKKNLTLSDFKNLAIANIPSLLGTIPLVELSTQDGRDKISNLILQATGISSKCTYLRGRKQERRFIDISKYQKPISCSGCGAQYHEKLKFCEACGQDLSNADWVSSVSYLQASNGEEVTIRLSLLEDAENDVVRKSDGEISQIIVQQLGPIIRRKDLMALMEANVLTELEGIVNSNLARDFQGYVSEIKLVDVRTANEDWFFKTEALINEELRKIETDNRFLAVDEAETDYMAAAFSMAIRRVKQNDSEQLIRRKTALEAKKNFSAVDIEEHALDTSVDLQKEAIDAAAERERMLRDRELNRERKKGDREDEVTGVDHKLDLDKKVVKHDIDVADLTGEAQSRAKRRDVSDLSFEQEEAIRLEAQKKAQLGHIEEDLQDRQNQRQIDKLKAMADMEASMAKQDNEFELSKVNSMKGMSAQEILAMQAAQLVKAGGAANAADIVKAMADSQAASSGASIKDEMYQKMLDIQKEATQVAIDAHKSAADSALRSSESMAKVAGAAASNSMDGYKEAAKIAQTTNEKSMESMAKVATATAGRKEGSQTSTIECKSPQCDAQIGLNAEGKPKKFCPKCGFNQHD